MSMTNKELNDLLKATRDQKFRKKTEGQINADSARLGGLKAALENPTFAKDRAKKQRENNPNMQQQINASLKQHHKENPRTEEEKYACGNNMRGKTLEEILGEEAADRGRKARSNASLGKKRPPEVGQKIAATRKANGSYQLDTHGMNGKEHKASTKEIMAVKAQIRQDLRRTLNMGKSGTLPKELLEAEYKRAGLK